MSPSHCSLNEVCSTQYSFLVIYALSFTFLPFNPNFCYAWLDFLSKFLLNLTCAYKCPLLHMHTHILCLLRYASKRWSWYNSLHTHKICTAYTYSYSTLFNFILFMYPLDYSSPLFLLFVFSSSPTKNYTSNKKATKMHVYVQCFSLLFQAWEDLLKFDTIAGYIYHWSTFS